METNFIICFSILSAWPHHLLWFLHNSPIQKSSALVIAKYHTQQAPSSEEKEVQMLRTSTTIVESPCVHRMLYAFFIQQWIIPVPCWLLLWRCSLIPCSHIKTKKMLQKMRPRKIHIEQLLAENSSGTKKIWMDAFRMKPSKNTQLASSNTQIIGTRVCQPYSPFAWWKGSKRIPEAMLCWINLTASSNFLRCKTLYRDCIACQHLSRRRIR